MNDIKEYFKSKDIDYLNAIIINNFYKKNNEIFFSNHCDFCNNSEYNLEVLYIEENIQKEYEIYCFCLDCKQYIKYFIKNNQILKNEIYFDDYDVKYKIKKGNIICIYVNLKWKNLIYKIITKIPLLKSKFLNKQYEFIINDREYIINNNFYKKIYIESPIEKNIIYNENYSFFQRVKFNSFFYIKRKEELCLKLKKQNIEYEKYITNLIYSKEDNINDIGENLFNYKLNIEKEIKSLEENIKTELYIVSIANTKLKEAFSIKNTINHKQVKKEYYKYKSKILDKTQD